MAVSCIIPTKDRSALVCRAIESVMAQDEPVDEIILVDDGSGDDTVARVGARFPAVKIVRERGLGAGPARNAGAAVARGDILMFLDSDDVWHPHHVRALCQAMAGGYPVAYGTTETSDLVSGGEFTIPDAGQARQGWCLEALAGWCFLVPSSLAVRRSVFHGINGFQSADLAEDWEFFIRLANRWKFGYAGERPVTRRELHPGSLCNHASRERILKSLDLVGETLRTTSVSARGMARFTAIREWSRSRYTDWQTVQQWYLALQQEELIP